ncbi:MAG: hypothetical protein HEEMFOPI_01830 [Holosporales bacterium]
MTIRFLKIVTCFSVICQIYANEAISSVSSSISNSNFSGRDISVGNITTNINIEKLEMLFSESSLSSQAELPSKSEDITYDHPFLNKVVKLQKRYSDLLGISLNKNVVALVGRTGSGKSTIANFLSDKKIRKNDDNAFELENPNDETAFPIGHGSSSETQYPKATSIADDLVLLDLPGFDRTGENTAEHFMDALFIREMFLKARSVRVLLVVSEAEIESGRAQELNSFFQRLNNVFDVDLNTIKGSTLLLVNKWSPKKSSPKVYCCSKLSTDVSPIDDWFVNGEFVFKRAFAQLQEDVEPDKKNILDHLKKIGSTKVTSCKMAFMYPKNIEEDLSGILYSLMNQDFLSYTKNPEEILSKVEKALNLIDEDFWDTFSNELTKNSSIGFFRKIFEEHYQRCFLKFQKDNQKVVYLLKENLQSLYERLTLEKHVQYLEEIDDFFKEFEKGVKEYIPVDDIIKQFSKQLESKLKEKKHQEIYKAAIEEYKKNKLYENAMRLGEKFNIDKAIAVVLNKNNMGRNRYNHAALKITCKASGASQERVAELFGCSQSTVSRAVNSVGR